MRTKNLYIDFIRVQEVLGGKEPREIYFHFHIASIDTNDGRWAYT